MKLRLLFLPACTLLASISATAQPAQTDGAATTARDESTIAVNTLEVSASAVSESTLTTSLIDLPAGPAADTAALSDAFAGFYIATTGTHSFNDTIALRGLSNTPIFGAPAVAVYLDELPLPGAATLPDQLAGLTGASLHRGPAESAAFGYASPGGVLVLHSPATLAATTSPRTSPSVASHGALRATAGDYSLRAGQASAGLISADGNTALAIALSSQSRDGYLFNRQLGHDVDHRDNRAGLIRVETRPFAPLTLAATVHATRSRDGEQPMVPLGGPLHTVARTGDGFTEHDAVNAGLTASVDTSAGKLSATASLNRWDLGPYRSVLAFGPQELANDVVLSRRNQNLELRFISPLDARAGWSATAFASRSEIRGSFARSFSGFIFEDSTHEIDDRPLALTAAAWTRFAPRWKLSAGLRAEHNDQTFFRQEKVPTRQTFALAAEDTAFLPRAELVHDLDAHTAWSLAAAAGRKPGGYSAFTGNRALAAFSPERTRSLETSVSRNFPRQRLRTTVRAYAYAISGYQIERSFATGAFTDDYLVVNAPRARSTGGEWETSWQATDDLSLRADLGLNRITLREFTDPYSKIVYNNRRAPYAPAHDARVTATYRLPAGFEASLAVNATGRIDYTESENPRYAQSSFTVIDASLSYRARHWRAELGARNVTDRAYYSAITPGADHGSPGAPATIALTVELFAPAR